LQTALVEENIGGCVAFYGRPLSAEDAGNVKAPIMGLYGSEDQGIPVSDIEIMQAAFEAAGIEHDIHVYEGAQHAFFNDTRASSYNEEASADAWQRTLGWFKQYL
jgi:carboxymethylenebutenolidase